MHSFVFFLSWSGHHRDLHSFPTRRSSDLHRIGAASRLRSSIWQTQSDSPARARERSSAPDGMQHPAVRRSEEHTSELQSLRHLVCRLLLEKKKINSKNDEDRHT